MKGITNATNLAVTQKSLECAFANVYYRQTGKVVEVCIVAMNISSGTNVRICGGLPIQTSGQFINAVVSNPSGDHTCLVYVNNSGELYYNSTYSEMFYGSLMYIAD